MTLVCDDQLIIYAGEI